MGTSSLATAAASVCLDIEHAPYEIKIANYPLAKKRRDTRAT